MDDEQRLSSQIIFRITSTNLRCYLFGDRFARSPPLLSLSSHLARLVQRHCSLPDVPRLAQARPRVLRVTPPSTPNRPHGQFPRLRAPTTPTFAEPPPRTSTPHPSIPEAFEAPPAPPRPAPRSSPSPPPRRASPRVPARSPPPETSPRPSYETKTRAPADGDDRDGDGNGDENSREKHRSSETTFRRYPHRLLSFPRPPRSSSRSPRLVVRLVVRLGRLALRVDPDRGESPREVSPSPRPVGRHLARRVARVSARFV